MEKIVYPPEITYFNFERIRYKYLLLYAALKIFENSPLNPATFDGMVDVIQEETGIKNRLAIKDTILYLINSTPTADDLAACSWRLVANRSSLKRGIPVPPAPIPEYHERLLFQIENSSYDGNAVRIEARSLIGQTAANKYHFSFKNIAPLFRRIVTIIKERLPNERFDLLYGLFFTGMCDRNTFGNLSVLPKTIGCPPKFLKHNNKVINFRIKLRPSAYKCLSAGQTLCSACSQYSCKARGYILL